MPRLPTLDDLGNSPTPVSRRGIAQNPGAGVVGRALEGFGNTVAGIGARELEVQDKLEQASARSALLIAAEKERQAVLETPDYEKWGQSYADRMKPLVGNASKLIRSRTGRAQFEAEAQLDIGRGLADLSTRAAGRRADTGQADMETGLALLEDTGRTAPDDASRAAIIGQAESLIQATAGKGWITAAQARARAAKWGDAYLASQIDVRRQAGDLAGARAILELGRGRLSIEAETRLEASLVDSEDNRQNYAIADEVAEGIVSAAPGTAASADRMVAITAQSESGNRERDGRGRLVTSNKGAQGRMQVMPGTARDPGYGIRPWDGQTDEDRSRVGRELLAALVERHDGDAAKAWASYNWDSSGNKVDALVRKYGDNWLDHAPAETRAYVRKNVEQLGGAQQAPREHDLNALYANVDRIGAERNLPPERVERIKNIVASRVQRDENLRAREQAAAFEGALEVSQSLGRDLKDRSQIGPAYYKMAPDQQMRIDAMVAENNKPVPVPANGDVIRSIHRMATDAPSQFIGANLAQYRPFVTDAEFDELSTSQAKAREEANGWSPRTGVQTAITWLKDFGGVELKQDSERYRVYRYAEARAREHRAQNNGKAPVETDYQRFVREGTAEVRMTRSFMGIDSLRPDGTERAQKVLSPNYRALIRRQFKAQFGRDPNETEIEQWFERMGEAVE